MKDPDEPLSEDQVAMVLRRAAELERREPGREGLTPAAEVEAIAAEVGLSRDAVGRALAEVRAGVLAEPPRPGTLDRLIGPGELVIERVVGGEAGFVGARLERFFASQLFQLRRRMGARFYWEHARGVLPGLRRTLDLSSRYAFPREAELESMVLELPGDDARVLVRIALHLKAARRDRMSSAGVGTLVGAGVAALGIAAGTMPTEALLVLAGSTTAAGSVARARRRYLADVDTAACALERFLDELP
jgi:hypothetical protein